MSGTVFGGDEVGALVFDFGTSTCKVGYAGEDAPKHVFPSVAGYYLEPETAEGSRKKPISGTAAIARPRPGVELRSPLKDSLVEDWETYDNLLQHAYSQCLGEQSDDHPLLIAEPSWNTSEKRERLAELLFEKYKIPALYYGRHAVLSAFTAGRSSALVLEFSASGTSAVPVYDGIVIRNGIRRNGIGGDFLAEQYRNFSEDVLHVDFVPQSLIASKKAVGEGEAPKFTLKQSPPLHPSYDAFLRNEIARDLHAVVGAVVEQEFDEIAIQNIPTTPYEFPTGFNYGFGLERFKISETLFSPSSIPFRRQAGGSLLDPKGCHQLVATSINACDTDVKNNLWSNILVTGGVSVVKGLTERLQHELTQLAPPSSKVKLHVGSVSVEKMYGPWIGGSILGSLGSFQQMWISKEEYDEAGKGSVARRCP